MHGIYPNGDNGPVPLKVIYEGNKKRLAITYKAHPQSYEDQKIYYFDEVELNQKFTISIQIIDGTGYVSISSNGISQKYEYSYNPVTTGWIDFYNYFKAGNYIQDYEDNSENAGSTVKMYNINVTHE